LKFVTFLSKREFLKYKALFVKIICDKLSLFFSKKAFVEKSSIFAIIMQ